MDEDDPLGLASWPDFLDRDAVMPALAEFVEVAGDGGDYDLIITSEFDTEVKARLDPAHAEVFAQERGDYGTAMAKTIPLADGRNAVVFDVRLFTKGAPDPRAMFRHEGLHVQMNRSHENAFDSRNILAERSDVFGDLVAMAGIAVEEYRVQRAVYELFPDDPWGGFTALCAASHDDIQQAAVDYYWDLAKDVEPFMSVVMRAFAAMTTQAGYIAAQVDAADRGSPTLVDVGLHDRMLGEVWHAVVTELRRLPPADERIDRGELERAVLRLAPLLADWLAQMGFGIEAIPGGVHFHVYEHEDWVERGPVRRVSVA